jgi:stress-induced morphogen
MADERLKQEIHDVLKQTFFNAPDDLVDVSDGPDDSIHLVLVSRKFDGKRMKAKHELVNELLTSQFPQEVLGRISLAVCKSPEDIKAAI